MLKIPYGKSDYRTLVEEEYFYQDRTSYLQTLEDWDSTYLMYLRPRRFGKSLLISTLHYYYGLQYQKDFDTLFGHTYIGKNPTRRANTYYVRKFYEVIKIATGEGIVERIFMTGVSPITVDSMTSGFNIAKNISFKPTFHQMVGFEEKEVEGILAGIEMPIADIPTTLNDLRSWYDGYLFSNRAPRKLYNPNMVLYFANEYKEVQSYPESLLDPNIASDYGKIQQLFNVQGNSEQHLEILKNLLETGEITATLTDQYSFTRGFTQDDLVSLLFYMGFLTIKSESLGAYTFSFPNYVIKKLYADYFFNSLLERAHLPIKLEYRELKCTMYDVRC